MFSAPLRSISLCHFDHDHVGICRYFRKHSSFDSHSSLAQVCVWQRANRTKKMWKWIWYAEIANADPIRFHTATANGHWESRTQFPLDSRVGSEEWRANMEMVSERHAQFHRENCSTLYIFHFFIDFLCFLVVVIVNSVRQFGSLQSKECSKYEIFVRRVTSTQPKFHLAKAYGIFRLSG